LPQKVIAGKQRFTNLRKVSKNRHRK